MIEETPRQKVVGAALITIFLSIMAVVITGWTNGLITGAFVAVALTVSENL